MLLPAAPFWATEGQQPPGWGPAALPAAQAQALPRRRQAAEAAALRTRRVVGGQRAGEGALAAPLAASRGLAA
jgi:hypothetical protein